MQDLGCSKVRAKNGTLARNQVKARRCD